MVLPIFSSALAPIAMASFLSSWIMRSPCVCRVLRKPLWRLLGCLTFKIDESGNSGTHNTDRFRSHFSLG